MPQLSKKFPVKAEGKNSEDIRRLEKEIERLQR